MVETEEQSGPGRGILLALGGVGILVGVLVAAALVVPLQPPLQNGCSHCPAVGGAKVVIPSGTGSNPNLNYIPAKEVVIIGQNNTVTFVNQDSVMHTVTAADKSFDSGDLKAGATWTHTFNTPGNYSYTCVYHPYMKGTIVVRPSSGESGVQVIIPPGTGSNLQLSFQPSTITVVIGVNNTVTWVNRDGQPHTVTATDSSYDSGNLVVGGTWSHTFTSAGTFSYVCSYHNWMKGTVVVKARG